VIIPLVGKRRNKLANRFFFSLPFDMNPSCAGTLHLGFSMTLSGRRLAHDHLQQRNHPCSAINTPGSAWETGNGTDNRLGEHTSAVRIEHNASPFRIRAGGSFIDKRGEIDGFILFQVDKSSPFVQANPE
jgi:hypothetical protein